MNEKFYTNERNIQIVLYLLKAYGIRKVIASPGTTNMTFVGSVQNDPFFEVYSSVDERSAAYIACGMAAESGEPVVITCTGATASRNYYPGLTEAFYRKLPVLALTSTQDPARIGQLCEQVIDRSQCANDLVVASEHIQFVEAASDEWNVTIKVNRALHALTKHGGGPIHLNLETRYSRDFTTKQLPTARVIKYVSALYDFPELPKGKIGIVIGSHRPMNDALTNAIDAFCKANGAAVFCSHTSNYKGEYGVSNTLVTMQDDYRSGLLNVDHVIHIGEISGGDRQMNRVGHHADAVWRVNEDGEVRDAFTKLTAVFEMPEEMFFSHYAVERADADRVDIDALRKEYAAVHDKIPDLPFSNMWIGKQTIGRLPEGCALHLGILNTIRSWNAFPLPKSVTCFSNTGGFGIDGDVSSLIGASLACPNKLFFGVVGDLAFFYDLNSMGNRHVGNNVRIMLINNGRGVEFRNPYHACFQFGEAADPYMAAAGHYGNKSTDLVRHYATDLGYEYLTASDKETFENAVARFLTPELTDLPIIFECFTNVEDEKAALWAMHHIVHNTSATVTKAAKSIIKGVLGDKGVDSVKAILKKK